MSITFDSWAWIEYFAGSELGNSVRRYIESEEQIYTPSISFMEIKSKYIHEGKPFEERLKFMEERSSVVDIDKEIAIEAATLKASEGLPSIDALVYACARRSKTKLLTADSHFEKIGGAEFLRK